MTHKAKIGDTVRCTVLGESFGKEYVVTAFYTSCNGSIGVWLRTARGERAGLLYESQYEVVKPELDMFLVTHGLAIGTTIQNRISSKESVEKRLNEPSGEGLVIYKLVPVEIKEVDVTVKKKVIG